ncbi:RHS repeat-associated core domain-containing protein [Pseudomonas sp. R151218B TE3479]
MSPSSKNILCRYHYDPLDRLTGLTPLGHPGTQRFYQNNELVNEIDSEAQLTIVRNGEQPLAQRLSVIGVTETTLLATDQQRSPLTAVTDADLQRMAYTAYGHRTRESGLSSLLGFNGERPEPITGHYLLGQGNRAFNPVLMRFNSPDELSPFGDGGINAYAYCGGDPVNRYDPTGNVLIDIFKINFLIGNPVLDLSPSAPLDLSLKTITRPASQLPAAPQINPQTFPIAGPALTNTVTPSAAPKTPSVAARLPPRQRATRPYSRTANPTKNQKRVYAFEDRQAKRVELWERFVKRNPDTTIDASREVRRRLTDALANLDFSKQGGLVLGDGGEVLNRSALRKAVSRAQLAVKADAWKKVQRLREIKRANRNIRAQ